MFKDNASGFYLDDIDVPRLSEEETLKLISRAQAGEKEAESAIILSNMRLIKHEATRFHRMGPAVEDLIQEGSMGMVKAIRLFDKSRETKFSTYAVYWIRSFMHRSTEHAFDNVRLPSYIREALWKYQRICVDCESKNQPIPDDEEAAQMIGISLERFLDAKAHICGTVSLDARIPQTDGDLDYMGTVADPSAEEAFDNAEAKTFYADMMSRMQKKLTEKEWDVIQRRYGLGVYHDMQTLAEIACDYGLTRERIRQIEGKAIRKMRQSVRSEYAHRGQKFHSYNSL